jgi:hypothetical protein
MVEGEQIAVLVMVGTARERSPPARGQVLRTSGLRQTQPCLPPSKLAVLPAPSNRSVPFRHSYLRISGAFGGVSLGAAADIANVSQAFQPDARCSASNSL